MKRQSLSPWGEGLKLPEKQKPSKRLGSGIDSVERAPRCSVPRPACSANCPDNALSTCMGGQTRRSLSVHPTRVSGGVSCGAGPHDKTPLTPEVDLGSSKLQSYDYRDTDAENKHTDTKGEGETDFCLFSAFFKFF